MGNKLPTPEGGVGVGVGGLSTSPGVHPHGATTPTNKQNEAATTASDASHYVAQVKGLTTGGGVGVSGAGSGHTTHNNNNCGSPKGGGAGKKGGAAHLAAPVRADSGKFSEKQK